MSSDNPSESRSDEPDRRRRTGGRLPIDRREYLQYAGALTGVPIVGGGMASADETNDSSYEVSEPTPVDLRVEYARNPVGVDVELPRFSWDVAAPGRDWTQRAYRIIVASTPEKLAANRGNVWDSGKVASEQSVNIEYAGPSLESGTRYHWKVKVWDDDGRASSWSDPGYWETGLLSEADWNATWIGQENETEFRGVEWTDYTFTVDVEILSENAGVLFRAQDEGNFYMWQLNTKNADVPLLRPHVRENGNWSVLKQIRLDDVVGDSFDGQHTLSVTVDGDEFTTRIDGAHVDTTTDSTHSAGTIGFREDSSERARFDNIRVTAPDGADLYADDFSAPAESAFPSELIEDDALVVQGTGPLLLGESSYENPSPLMRTEAELGKEIESARAYVAGLGFHELYVNGDRIGEQVLHPGQTDFEKTVLYETYDVTEALREGTNAIGVALGRARYGELNGGWGWNDVSWWSDPELRAQVEVEFADGSVTTIETGGGWSVVDGPTRYDSLLGGEIYDAREERTGWTESEYDDSDWETSITVEGPGGELMNQLAPPITVRDTIEPDEILEPEPGVYVFDMGEMIAGWPVLTVDGPEGTTVSLTMGEKLEGFPENETGRVDNDYFVSPLQEDEYILSGEGTETWKPRFTYHGFRYVQIEGFPGTPTTDALQAEVVYTEVDANTTSTFRCSNDLFNQIHENTRRALTNNLHSIPTDTPMFEKMAYGGDGLAMTETTIYNYLAPRFYTKWIRDLGDAQEEGLVPSIAPAVEGRYSGRNATAAGWGSAYVIIPWWAYQYYGDERLLETNYEGMKAYVDVLIDQADGLIHPGGFGDYNAPGTFGEPPEGSKIVGTSYFYRDAEVLSEVASVLGHEEDAQTYAALVEEIRTAFNDEFLDTDANIYRTGETDEYRQTSNVMPLAFGMVPDDREDAVVANLVADVMERRDGHLNTGVHGTKWLLPVLTEHGHHDVAYTVATQRTYPSWGWWIENGFTALLEDWDITEGSRSLDHQYFGSIDEWFYKYVAGVRSPSDPGYEAIEIAPEIVPELDWAEASVETVRGIVDVRWERTTTVGEERTTDGIVMDVTVPENATAAIRIPTFGGAKTRVREGEKTIWNNGNQTDPGRLGIRSVQRDQDVILVEVGSGEYELELEQIGE